MVVLDSIYMHFPPGRPFAESAPDWLSHLGTCQHVWKYVHAACDECQSRIDVYGFDIENATGGTHTGLAKENASAQSPSEWVEGTMQLLFDDSNNEIGKGYELKKNWKLVFSDIDTMPHKH